MLGSSGRDFFPGNIAIFLTLRLMRYIPGKACDFPLIIYFTATVQCLPVHGFLFTVRTRQISEKPFMRQGTFTIYFYIFEYRNPIKSGFNVFLPFDFIDAFGLLQPAFFVGLQIWKF